MSLEQRILNRWKKWWTDKHNPPVDRCLLQLIEMALEEVQRGMTEPRFTVKESIALEHLVSTVQAFVSPELPMTDTERIEAIQKLVTPEVLSAAGKLHMELDNIKQTQERNFLGISGTHKNCPVCKRPIPKKRKYCSIRCSNMAQSRKSVEARKKNGEDGDEN